MRLAKRQVRTSVANHARDIPGIASNLGRAEEGPRHESDDEDEKTRHQANSRGGEGLTITAFCQLRENAIAYCSGSSPRSYRFAASASCRARNPTSTTPTLLTSCSETPTRTSLQLQSQSLQPPAYDRS